MSDDAALSIVGIVFTVVGILITVLTWLAARGTLPLNPVAGLRLPSTMRSPAAWQAGHRAALPTIAVTSVLVIAGSAVFLLARPESPSAVSIVTFGIAGILIAGMVVACVFASRAANRVD